MRIKVAVVGAGGVGGYFGARLAQHPEADVWFLVRPRCGRRPCGSSPAPPPPLTAAAPVSAQLGQLPGDEDQGAHRALDQGQRDRAALQGELLTPPSPADRPGRSRMRTLRRSAPPRLAPPWQVAGSAAEIGPVDYVIVCVKTFNLEELAPTLRPLLKPEVCTLGTLGTLGTPCCTPCRTSAPSAPSAPSAHTLSRCQTAVVPLLNGMEAAPVLAAALGAQAPRAPHPPLKPTLAHAPPPPPSSPPAPWPPLTPNPSPSRRPLSQYVLGGLCLIISFLESPGVIKHTAGSAAGFNMASTPSDDTAPSARPVPPGALAAPPHPSAPPEHLESSP